MCARRASFVAFYMALFAVSTAITGLAVSFSFHHVVYMEGESSALWADDGRSGYEIPMRVDGSTES